jgi:hypothetical protein
MNWRQQIRESFQRAKERASLERFGMRIETSATGERTYVTEWGTSITPGAGGTVFRFSKLSKVGIADLTEVESHQITRIAGSTSHVVRFFGGGFVQFAYNSRGELIDLRGHSITASHDRNGDLTIGAYRALASDGVK